MPEGLLFRSAQQALADYLRDPGINPPPAGVEERRLKIYRELIYNNIESFISSGFPVLRSIFDDADWHEMVSDFILSHQCNTPYFLEISQEFLRYLQEERGHKGRSEKDPPFMLELAHYEWVELALDVSTESIGRKARVGDIASNVLEVSPLAWRLCYQFPVHRIGVDFQPQVPPEQATFLVVYRDRQQQVKFLEINAVTSRLLQLLEESPMTGIEALTALSIEMGHENTRQMEAYGLEILAKLQDLDILY